MRKGIAADNLYDDEELEIQLTSLRMGFHFDAAREVAYEVFRKEAEKRAAAEETRRRFADDYEVPEITERGLVERAFFMQEGDGEYDDEYDDESPVSSPRQMRRRLAREQGLEGGHEDEMMEDQEGCDEETEED